MDGVTGRCIVVGAGEFTETALKVQPQDLLIAADGGWQHLLPLGVAPQLVLGDFDSSPRPPFGQVLQFPERKDQTDTQLALQYGFDQGYRRFAVYGGTGGRIDHTLANLQCLAALSRKGAHAVLYGVDYAVCAVTNGALELPAAMHGTVSVFAYGGTAHGVTVEGLSYTAQNVDLADDVPLGVSNRCVGTPARISVQNGTLLVYWQRQPTEPNKE
jgi:thiamine pyrophosphokinase